jgi:hypothetical protein
MKQDELPAGARQIQPEELLAAIGELYVQVRVMRQAIQQQQQQQPAPPNGVAEPLVNLSPSGG